jgi:hypothetical protein
VTVLAATVPSQNHTALVAVVRIDRIAAPVAVDHRPWQVRGSHLAPAVAAVVVVGIGTLPHHTLGLGYSALAGAVAEVVADTAAHSQVVEISTYCTDVRAEQAQVALEKDRSQVAVPRLVSLVRRCKRMMRRYTVPAHMDQVAGGVRLVHSVEAGEPEYTRRQKSSVAAAEERRITTAYSVLHSVHHPGHIDCKKFAGR